MTDLEEFVEFLEFVQECRHVKLPAIAHVTESQFAPTSDPEPEVALGGVTGETVQGMLDSAISQGTGILATITRQAVKRLLAHPNQTPASLFTPDELEMLADSLAAVRATADQLARALVRDYQRRVEEKHRVTESRGVSRGWLLECGGPGSGRPGPCPSMTSAKQIGKNAGVDVDAKGSATIRKFMGAKAAAKIPALYLDSTKQIHINEKSSFWEDAAEVAKKQHASGFWSSDSPDHIIHHEVAHAIQDKSGNLGKLKNQQISIQAKNELAGKVSRYALTEPKEFVAEVYAGMKAGKKYDEDVMRWYKNFYGPELS